MATTTRKSASHDGSPEPPAAVRAAALDFAESSHEFSKEMAEHLHGEIPELDSEDAELLRQTQASCQSNLSQSYRLLHSGRSAEEFAITPEARDYVLAYVERGIALPALLRSYRLGHAWIWHQWAEKLKASIDDPSELSQAVEFSSLWMFEYIDLASAALVEEFARVQSLRLRSADQLATATVRELIAGEPIEVDVASRRLGYELRRYHVALRVSASEDAKDLLEAESRSVAALLGAGEPLIVRSGALALTAWCGFDSAAGLELSEILAGHVPSEGIRVATGQGTTKGVEGFVSARAEAVEAERIAAVAGARLPAITLYEEIELVSLLAADEPRAKKFVERQLGELAAGDEGTARLRETVLAFLQARGSSSRAAKELFVHQNTVTYRIHRAEELLGRPLGEERAELLCALILAVMLGYGNGLPSQPS